LGITLPIGTIQVVYFLIALIKGYLKVNLRMSLKVPPQVHSNDNLRLPLRA
jgi:hypothetical protein